MAQPEELQATSAEGGNGTAVNGKASPSAAGTQVGNLVGSFTLSYLFGAGLLVALFYYGGPWNIMANTRVLDLLINGGIIRYHDMNIGYVDMVPAPKYYLLSQDPIDWRYVYAAAGVYLLFWVIMAMKFHGIARFCGLTGTLGSHTRAFIYGDCLNRFFPFWMGNVGTTLALEGQGESRQRANMVLYIQDVFVLWATIIFGVIGLFIFGWKSLFLQLMWPILIFYVTYLLAKQVHAVGGTKEKNAWLSAWDVIKNLWHKPVLLLRLCTLALLCVLCDDFCPYFISRAFTSDHVIMNVDFFTVQNGVVAGYICRLILYTPGGIGAYEWGFATALYMSGVGFPEAATIALLDSLVRNVTYTVGFIVLKLCYSVETDVGQVFRLFTRSRSELASV
ncbi:hypothetical protein AYO44_09685 [Planctomycetaceae bacterium SCGC AG-212-F19]|nr:hypothetical protein AYO44_09685 [Planctomycetaceae bacterium SCGC AG-212-F19]